MKHSNCFILLGLLMLVLALANAEDFKDDGDLKCGYLYDGIAEDVT